MSVGKIFPTPPLLEIDANVLQQYLLSNHEDFSNFSAHWCDATLFVLKST